jgi:cyclopropane-fatty-acyl-phospholipid synthase
MVLCFKFLSRLPQGELQVTIPDGSRYVFGQPGSAPAMKMEIHEYRFFRRAMFSGDIGFGEAYTDGDWTTDDLPGLLTLLAANEADLDDRRIFTAKIGRGLNYLRHLLRANTLKGSSRNIREHYDLSNDFFATFLDKSMTYSSALFSSERDSLADAQRNKIESIIAKAGITSEDHVLEIGCGWGGFAIEAVRQTGCRLTGITLSHEQLALARERVKAAGLEERIDLQLCDYRHAKGEYSKIVSIEMLEAVGHAGLKPFFVACERLLKPGGKAVIQVITIPDRKYASYRYSSDWIRKHIFPGGHLPSVGVLAQEMAAGSRLIFGQLEHFGLDYARTLDLWRETLLAKRREIVELGYDDNFLRKWDYYFSYCMAGFEARIIDLAQLVVEKPLEVRKGQVDVRHDEQAA